MTEEISRSVDGVPPQDADDVPLSTEDDLLPAEDLMSVEEYPPDEMPVTAVSLGLGDVAAPEIVSARAPAPAGQPAGTTAAEGVVRYSQGQVRRARELLARLSAARRAARFYPVEHPAVSEAVLSVLETVGAYHSEGVDVHLGFFEGEIVLGEQLLTEESVFFDQLVRDMNAIGVGSLLFLRGVTEDEIRRATKLLGADAIEIEAAGGFDALLGTLGLTHIAVGSVRLVERVGKSAEGDEQVHVVYGGAVSLMREVDRLMRLNKNVSSSKVKGVVRSLVDNVLSNRYAMLQLTGLKNYDEYTFYHSANVAILSLALGSMITSDYRFLSSLGIGALLHDIGKLSVDLDVLNKPGALDPEEWSNVRLHPVYGAEMVSMLPGVDKSAMVAILEHHMRYDGAGYPARVPPRRQHLASRIVAVADSYDAMTSRRSYSAARVQDRAMLLLAQSGGGSLDPVLLRLFIRLMGVYPPRSVVRMGGGEIAVVIRPSEADPVRPIVRIIAAPSGDFIESAEVDLTTAPGLSILGCVDSRALNIDVDSYFN